MPKLFHKTLNSNPVTTLRRATRRPEGSPYFLGNFGRGKDKSSQRSQQLPSSRNRITDITRKRLSYSFSGERQLRDSNKSPIVPDTQYPKRKRERETHTWAGVLYKRVALTRNPVQCVPQYFCGTHILVLRWGRTPARYFSLQARHIT